MIDDCFFRNYTFAIVGFHVCLLGFTWLVGLEVVFCP